MLNVNQTNAVNHFNGPCLTLAGPGSGKTTVLVDRIIKLIERGVNPEEILVITFTRDAALEMKVRFLKKCAPNSYDVCFGTFHSVFFSILKQSQMYSDFEILTGAEKISLYDECARKLNLKELSNSDIKTLSKDVSYYYNTGENRDFKRDSTFSDDEFFNFLDTLAKRKTDHKRIDFDDMLVLTRDLLKNNNEVLKYWQNKFSYFLIDELQDINNVQFSCVKLLLNNHPCGNQNIFGVGDDDQSIYGFRGASPEFMLDFPKVFKDTKVILLDKNYRSASSIVNSAKCLIEKNKERYDKDFSANSTDLGTINFREFEDEHDEAKKIADEIDLKLKDEKSKDIAILYRNKKNAALLFSLLKMRGISVFSNESIGGFKNTEICKDICAYLRLIIGNYKRKDILRVMNKPNRHLNRGGLNHENVNFSEWLDYYPKGSNGYENILKFKNELEFMKRFSPFSILSYIKKGLRYEEYLKDKSNEEESAKDISVFNMITMYAAEFDDAKLLLNDLLKNDDKIEKKQRAGEQVCFFTFHGSKGLEFNEVYIIDAIEGITPSKNAKNEKLIEEERRMFYVAVTRAKNTLNICYPKNFSKEKSYPSRFLSEMKNDI